MARPTKEGLDYFPLDVDIDQDDKIALIEATHGLEGFGIIIKLLMKIYDNSYFYKWGEKEQLLFSRRVNVNINRVNDIINDCVKWGIFSKRLYEQHEILSSAGIQRRYLEASSRRKQVNITSDYLLLDEKEVNAYKNLVIVNINSINEEFSAQSKVKESKGKESKAVVNENSTAFALIKKYLELKNQMHHSSKDELAAQEVEKEGVPPDEAVQYLEECFRDYESKKKHSRDQINTLNYCVGYILDRHYQEREESNNVTGIRGRRGSYSKNNRSGTSYEQAKRELDAAERAFGGH
ncbi:DUF4373 domain-containing protein [Virgibacillus sp. AGTR]|uniref:DUF4373 domain-containing protein n=1 Tax=Virgibacillus sp. AGTR TaxID=2812055 RepID=UPI001D168B1D|nr:DUF4373 domain-containing protein [Virgibacillus sp. AGTR]MCC2250041.1 DUF4373 domain-containing protein [Virgibacillus sp. AGTR]